MAKLYSQLNAEVDHMDEQNWAWLRDHEGELLSWTLTHSNDPIGLRCVFTILAELCRKRTEAIDAEKARVG